MGAMADLDELIAEVHRRGMRIILDLAVNHTSDQHPWFDAALADPTGPAGDYFFISMPGPFVNRDAGNSQREVIKPLMMGANYEIGRASCRERV